MTYEEQQAALRAQVPQGTAAATELARQGFTDVGTSRNLVDYREPGDTRTPEEVISGGGVTLRNAANRLDLTKVPTQGIGPDGKPIYDVFAGQEHIADPNDPRLKGIDIAGLPEGQPPEGFQSKFEPIKSRFQQGFQDAVSAGISSVEDTQGMNVVERFAPQKSNDLSSFFVQQDQFLGGLTKAFQDYTNPNTQRESLVSAYKSMSKELGLEPLNEKLINLDKVMRGTDEAIREQITRSGGFANENQVRAMVVQRNKSFLEEYTTLQQTLASKEKYLGTLIGLEKSDREAASERFNQSFDMASKLADYQQRGQQFAQSSYQWIAEKAGFDGLFNSAGGDPYAIDLIEKTLGLPTGGLKSSADQAKLVRTQTQQKEQLDLALKRADLAGKPLDFEYKQAQIANIYSEIAKRREDNTVMLDPLGKVIVKPQEALKLNKELVGSDAYKSLQKAKDSLQYLKQFEDTFKKTGATSAVFSPRQNAKLKAEYNTTILNLKEFFNLGVLNGPDEAILRSVIPDPTNRSAALSIASLGIYKPSASTKAGIENMKKMIEASIDDRYKSLSSQYGDYSSSSVNGLRDLNRVYVEQKAKLNPEIQKLVNENPNLTPDDLLMIITQ